MKLFTDKLLENDNEATKFIFFSYNCHFELNQRGIHSYIIYYMKNRTMLIAFRFKTIFSKYFCNAKFYTFHFKLYYTILKLASIA